MSNQDAFDATQRVDLDANGHPTTAPRQRQPARRPRPTPSQRAAKKRRQQRIMLISLCAAAVILLLVLVIVLINALSGKDDGKILANVTVAGTELGGLTQEEAREILEAVAQNYTTTPMTVTVTAGSDEEGNADTATLTFQPTQTKASLDVEAVLEAAYSYGRTGSRAEQRQAKQDAQSGKVYAIPVLNYLTLDTDYIRNEVNTLAQKYNTLLTQATYVVEGEAPPEDLEEFDTSKVYQTVTITMGTPYYELKINDLYTKIITAYETNVFQVSYSCSIETPAPPDCLAIQEDLGYTPAVSESYNESTGEIIEGTYGYGVTLEELQNAISRAGYGESVTVELRLIAPPDPSDAPWHHYYEDTLAYLSTDTSDSNAWNTNLRLVAQLLDGTKLLPGDTFSFNRVVGNPTHDRGFVDAEIYPGMSLQTVTGGGISQAASMLYYCALKADLEILERNSHSYAVEFILRGFDAQVDFSENMDLRFRNNTDCPILIHAEVSGGKLKITLLGTDSLSYSMELQNTIDRIFPSGVAVNTMSENNAGGYTDGQVLRPGQAGYLVSTYQIRDGVSQLVAQSYYAALDQVIVEIYTPPVEPPVDLPEDPDTPVDPENPENPELPEVPDVPGIPGDPDLPDTPVTE